MKSLFGFGSKLTKKLTATQFVYTFTIHNLAPWPHAQRAIAVGWQRGSKKRGATRSVYPSTAPGRIGSVVRFNEKFDVAASLYKASTGSSVSSSLGSFKKKCIILAILETDGRTQATAALGRVVIDLAEFAAIEKQETRTFQVSCNKSIHAAVGEPQLTVTIRARWKESSASAGLGQDGLVDEIGSISTDTTGSRMTANLSSFLRFKHNLKGQANEDQDLQGFDSSAMQAVANAKAREGQMGTIQEGSDDEHAPRSRAANLSGDGARRAGLESPSEFPAPRANGGAPRTTALSAGTWGSGTSSAGAGAGTTYSLRDTYSPASGASNGTSLRDTYGAAGGTDAGAAVGSSLRDTYAAGARTAAGPGARDGFGAAAAPDTAAGMGSSLRDTYALPPRSPTYSRLTEDSMPAVSLPPSRRDTDELVSAKLQTARSGPSGSELSDKLSDKVSNAGPSTYTELMTLGALEVCVYLARISARGRKPERNVHAAARRTARTVVCLGQQQGTAFGRQVAALVTAQASALGSDLTGIAYWWTNAVHLRGLLMAMENAEYAVSSMPNARWASDALLPQMLHIERSLLFPALMHHMWEKLLQSSSSAAPAAAAAAKGVPVTKRAMQEAAIKHWLGALTGLSQLLEERLGSRGHVKLLKQQVLQQCMQRLDALLFHHLLTDAGDKESTLLRDYDPNDTLWGHPGAPVPALEEACLPFTRGLLTFGSGMSVKMTVTRMQQWAASQGLGYEGGAQLQFPLLRTAADLLMMPKELLMEQAIRRDVSQGLSLRSMLHILEKFQPDDYAQDAIAPELVQLLREEQAVAPSSRPPLSDLSLSYRPPTEEAIMHKADPATREPGIEYDADSEGELEELGQLVGGGQVPSRIRMLHQLWALGVPRRRAA